MTFPILLLAMVFLLSAGLLFTYSSSGRLGSIIWGPAGAPAWTPIADSDLDTALDHAGLSGDQFLTWLALAYPVRFRQRSGGGRVNFLTRRVTLGSNQHLATLDALLCIAHESVHVTQGQRWPVHTRLAFLAGTGAVVSAIATGILLALGAHDAALVCASLTVLGMAYHLPWHLYLETEATQQAPAVLHAFLEDSASASVPLPPSIRPTLDQHVAQFTADTRLHYPAQITTILLQNLLLGLYWWALTFATLRWMFPHLL